MPSVVHDLNCLQLTYQIITATNRMGPNLEKDRSINFLDIPHGVLTDLKKAYYYFQLIESKVKLVKLTIRKNKRKYLHVLVGMKLKVNAKSMYTFSLDPACVSIIYPSIHWRNSIKISSHQLALL